LEIIGEAVNHLPDEIRKNYPDVPWRQISGMRNVIIHEYFGVTMEMIWLVATEDIVELKTNIVKILNSIT